MCIKAVDYYAHALAFVPNQYRTKEIKYNPFMLRNVVMIDIRHKKYVIKS